MDIQKEVNKYALYEDQNRNYDTNVEGTQDGLSVVNPLKKVLLAGGVGIGILKAIPDEKIGHKPESSKGNSGDAEGGVGDEQIVSTGRGDDDKNINIEIGDDTTGNSNVTEGETGIYGDLASRSVRDGMTPDHIPSFASVRKAVEDSGIELSPAQLKALRNNTNCVVVKTCDHQSFSRTYGGRNSQSQILADAEDLKKAANADLDTWEPVWRDNGWSDADIALARKEVHNLNRKTFEELGIPYGSD